MLILDEPTVGMDVEARRSFWVSVRGFAARGKTVIFATHYLEEADAYADRAVLMAHGRVVADGATSEIRARGAGARSGRRSPTRTLADLSSLPGVTAADRRGDEIVLVCADSDAAIRGLLESYPEARDIEIARAGLEEAFIELTGDPRRPLGHDRAAGGTRMRSLAYTRFELVRTFATGACLVFSLGFPLMLFFIIAAPNRHERNFDGSGICAARLLHGRTGRVRGDERADRKRRANREPSGPTAGRGSFGSPR